MPLHTNNFVEKGLIMEDRVEYQKVLIYRLSIYLTTAQVNSYREQQADDDSWVRVWSSPMTADSMLWAVALMGL